MDVSVGSYVIVSQNQAQQEYMVRQMDEQGIYISSIDNPNQISLLVYINNEWKVYDEQLNGPSPIPYQIQFLPDVSYLLSLPPEIILEIALRLPISNILNICSTNRELNEFICESEYFWSVRTHQDYPEDVNLKKDDQTWKEFYRILRSSYVWSFGRNYMGGLGLGDNIDYYEAQRIPTQIVLNNKSLRAKQISAGSHHSLVIDLNDNVWSFGWNKWGQLGLGDNQDRDTPTQIFINNQPLKAKQIATGNQYSLVIDLHNNVWSFGLNTGGQAGLGEYQIKYIPTQIYINNQPLKAKQISAGSRYSLFIDINNNVWVSGWNKWGRLGLDDYQNRRIPIQIFINNRPFQAKQISAGSGHSLIIDLNNDVWSFGENGYGQLGLGDSQDRDIPTQIKVNNQPLQAKQISAGSRYSLIIDLNNNVLSFGDYHYSGLELSVNIYIPSQIMMNNQPLQAKRISAGDFHSLIIDLNNNIVSFGSNKEGQLGLGDNQVRYIPTQIFIDYRPLKAEQISAGHEHSLVIGYI